MKAEVAALRAVASFLAVVLQGAEVRPIPSGSPEPVEVRPSSTPAASSAAQIDFSEAWSRINVYTAKVTVFEQKGHDPLATTIRGSSIDQLSVGAILEHAQHTTGTLSTTAGNAIDGSRTTAVVLDPAVAATDAVVTREIIEVSATTHLPMRVLGYAGQVLVRKIDFSNVTVKA